VKDLLNDALKIKPDHKDKKIVERNRIEVQKQKNDWIVYQCNESSPDGLLFESDAL
jgi:hypothetical protein